MADAISKGEVKYIQTLRRQVFGMDDFAYRLMLWEQARVKSCKDLNGLQVQAVINYLERRAGKAPPERYFLRKIPPQAGLHEREEDA